MVEEKNKPEKKPASAEASSFDKSSEDKSAGKEESNIEELKKKLEECEKLKNEYLNNWQRERADFLNYKKEELERIDELLKYGEIGLILKCLTILDNFELAEKKIPENLKKDENVKGLLQIKSQIQEFLKSRGIEEIKSIGEQFDPNFHEVVGEVESSSSADKRGIIVEEIQKGYKFNGKVLRPAKIKIIK
jgi:molecular chaperone GrpE